MYARLPGEDIGALVERAEIGKVRFGHRKKRYLPVVRGRLLKPSFEVRMII
jgi:hypothetical protein